MLVAAQNAKAPIQDTNTQKLAQSGVQSVLDVFAAQPVLLSPISVTLSAPTALAAL